MCTYHIASLSRNAIWRYIINQPSFLSYPTFECSIRSNIHTSSFFTLRRIFLPEHHVMTRWYSEWVSLWWSTHPRVVALPCQHFSHPTLLQSHQLQQATRQVGTPILQSQGHRVFVQHGKVKIALFFHSWNNKIQHHSQKLAVCSLRLPINQKHYLKIKNGLVWVFSYEFAWEDGGNKSYYTKSTSLAKNKNNPTTSITIVLLIPHHHILLKVINFLDYSF